MDPSFQADLMKYLGGDEATSTQDDQDDGDYIDRDEAEARPLETTDGGELIVNPNIDVLSDSDDELFAVDEPEPPDEEISHMSFNELEKYERQLARENEADRVGRGRVFPHIADRLPITRGRLGQLATEDTQFTPATALFKFPWKHLPSHLSEPVGREYFAAQKVLDRTWDVYYLYPPDILLDSKAILLLRSDQVQSFFDFINQQTGYNLEVLSEAVQPGFVTDFKGIPQVRPRYLGYSRTRYVWNQLKNMIPPENYIPPGEERGPKHGPGDRSYLAFKKKVEQIQEANKSRTKAQQARKQELRIQRQARMGDLTHRVQRYIGLRRRTQFKGSDSAKTPASNGSAPPVISDPTSGNRFPCESEPLFISFDCEAYEKSQDFVTEIGISIMDTRDIADVAPGPLAQNWHPFVKTRHIRVREHAHMRNGQYVPDNADRFDYGESEFISLYEIPSVLAKAFRQSDSRDPTQFRKVVLIGHDPDQDVNYLRKIGYDIKNLNQNILIDVVDTRNLYQWYRSDGDPSCSLIHIMHAIGLTAWVPHQAAHDAYYTLQAVLALAILDLERTEKGRKEAARKELEKKAEEAAERARTGGLGWDDDGLSGGEGIVTDDVGQTKKDFGSGARGDNRGDQREGSNSFSRPPRQQGPSLPRNTFVPRSVRAGSVASSEDDRVSSGGNRNIGQRAQMTASVGNDRGDRRSLDAHNMFGSDQYSRRPYGHPTRAEGRRGARGRGGSGRGSRGYFKMS